ncbi:MAG TPA: zf-HC2 domain-containing protein [Polyangiaceae bacterium]|nr:zf-HC2 domain-containing protein [Polyangiaceae bacterium]
MTCRSVVPLLEPFVDGELLPEKVVEVEQHLEECSRCVERVRLGRAVRISLRRAVRPSSEPSTAFRARLAAAMQATHEREQMLEQQIERTRMLSWRTIVPVAVAAAAMLVVANVDKNPVRTASGQIESANVDQLIEELINHHVQGRPEVTSLSLLPSLEKEVGVPVQPPLLTQYGGRWEGASVVPMNNQRAASLRYKVAGHPVTLYMYDSSRFQQLENRLQRRLVGDAPVYVGARRGYSIGATEHRGVGYAVATDLNEPETAELVAALH